MVSRVTCCCNPANAAIITSVLALLVGIALHFPTHLEAEVTEAQYHLLRESIPLDGNEILAKIPVVSFNIRLDGLERDPNNHFVKRLPRLAGFFNRVEPWLVGLQEPFSGQLMHLQSVLPPYFKAVGYRGHGHGGIDRADPRRHHDFQTAILYDSRHLEMLKSDHIWLSPTPRVEGSQGWGSVGKRTATVAVFRLRDRPKLQVLHVNTHLDVWSEPARREQAQLLLKLVKKWATEHPSAVVFVTGDFNTANGQAPHRFLTGRHSPLVDAWDACEASSSLPARLRCHTNSFGSTFHGWLGTRVNSYAFRVLHFLLQILHGSGVVLPHHAPASAREGAREVRRVLGQLDLGTLWSGVPASWSRLHVDWVLFAPSQRGLTVVPRSVFVGDVRSSNCSSDHFPVVALMEVVGRLLDA